jgi:hypothetical protein
LELHPLPGPLLPVWATDIWPHVGHSNEGTSHPMALQTHRGTRTHPKYLSAKLGGPSPSSWRDGVVDRLVGKGPQMKPKKNFWDGF